MDLVAIVGLRLGPGPWLEVDAYRLERFWTAVDHLATPGVPLLYLVSLLPALTAELKLSVPTPRATINYGLNWMTGGEPVGIGDRLRAITTVTQAEWLGTPDASALQVVREAEVANQNLEVVLRAETVGRLFF